MRNTLSFKVKGRYALFTDPITKIGGEKCTYHIPTYEALKGIVSSIYWKPTLTWIIDKVRVINPIATETKNVKPLNVHGGNTLSTYTYLIHPEYQVSAHFVWNTNRTDLEFDRNENKHYAMAKRMLDKGGRRDIFLGTRECQGYVEPCEFMDGYSHYDDKGELAYGLMFHGFDYPDESDEPILEARFWKPVMKNGVIEFIPPRECEIRKKIRPMQAHQPKTKGLLDEELES